MYFNFISLFNFLSHFCSYSVYKYLSTWNQIILFSNVILKWFILVWLSMTINYNIAFLNELISHSYFRINTMVYGCWDLFARSAISGNFRVHHGKLVLELHSWTSFPFIECKYFLYGSVLNFDFNVCMGKKEVMVDHK